MTAAIEYIGRMIPRGSPVFVDYKTREVLRYYLARNEPRDTLRPEAVVEEQLGGYCVVGLVSRMPSLTRDPHPSPIVWAFRPDEALQQITESARALGVPSGDPLWIVSAAWSELSLASRLPARGDRDFKEFGRIGVIRVSAQKR
jgi:hypothetical protein